MDNPPALWFLSDGIQPSTGRAKEFHYPVQITSVALRFPKVMCRKDAVSPICPLSLTCLWLLNHPCVKELVLPHHPPYLLLPQCSQAPHPPSIHAPISQLLSRAEEKEPWPRPCLLATWPRTQCRGSTRKWWAFLWLTTKTPMESSPQPPKDWKGMPVC